MAALKSSKQALGLYMPEGGFHYPVRLEWDEKQLMAQPLLFLHGITKRVNADSSEIKENE
jgi:hypothetical protein